MGVTAAVRGQDGRSRLGLVFLDTASAGVSVSARHDFLGSRGLSNGSLRFDAVRVPAERVLVGGSASVAGQPPSVGRLLMNAAPALGIARECLAVAREFVAGRVVDGRPLGDYEQVQRFFATTMAEIHALDSVIRWCLLDVDRGFEQLLAKNIVTVAAWRIADETVTILGGEGVETAASKHRRGGAALPAERLLRDARMMRIGGNVDVMLDIQAGHALLARHAGHTEPCREWLGSFDHTGLSPANQDHLRALVDDLRRLSRTATDLARRFPEPATVPGGQQTHRLLGRISGELLTMFVVLLRSDEAGELADLHCTVVRHRLAGLWHELSTAPREFTGIL
jgi:hypothetical protein